MAIETEQTTETVTTSTETVEQPQAQTPDQIKAELASAKAALQAANNEAAKRRKQLEAYEKDAQAKKDSELSETDRLKKQLAEYESRIKAHDHEKAQFDAATKSGLPAAFADRLKGETPEELEADARKLLEALPKSTKSTPTLNPTNPAGASSNMGIEGGISGLSEAQLKALIRGDAQSTPADGIYDIEK